MDMGCRIKTIRLLRGLTQKELGIKLGYSENTADIRIAQYENGSRTPKEETIEKIAEILKVEPGALKVPHINDINDIVQVLFLLEDICGLRANIIGQQPCLSLDGLYHIAKNPELLEFLNAWKFKVDALAFGGISKAEYDDWRYNFSFDQ